MTGVLFGSVSPPPPPSPLSCADDRSSVRLLLPLHNFSLRAGCGELGNARERRACRFPISFPHNYSLGSPAQEMQAAPGSGALVASHPRSPRRSGSGEPCRAGERRVSRSPPHLPIVLLGAPAHVSSATPSCYDSHAPPPAPPTFPLPACCPTTRVMTTCGCFHVRCDNPLVLNKLLCWTHSYLSNKEKRNGSS